MQRRCEREINVNFLNNKFTKLKQAGFFALLAVLALTLSAGAQVTTASVHGKVNNPAGVAVNHGDVKFTPDKTSEPKDRKYPFSFPLDKDGTYKGSGIPAGDYVAVVFSDDKTIDFQMVTFKNGEDKLLNFDMTREEFLKALSPEERAAIEENKKHNASVVAENSKIANINATLLQARADEKNGKAEDAVNALKPLTEARPNEALVWAALGEAQLAAADAASKAARAAHTPTTDPAIVSKYSDAATYYQKSIDLDAQAKKPIPQLVSSAYINLGQAFAKQGKLSEASGAYENAVKADPTIAGMAYFNEAATFFNAQKMDEAAVAADKAIAADPKRAEAYYIKAQALIPKATMDPKTQKFILPPGCLEAYQSYLELVPEGGHAAEVKDLLNNLGQPQKSSFKAGRK